MDDYDDDDDDDDEEQIKLEDYIENDVLYKFHPEIKNINNAELDSLTKIKRDSKDNIIFNDDYNLISDVLVIKSNKDINNYDMRISYDIDNILNAYNKNKHRKKLILTTEKDAVKLINFKGKFERVNIYVLPIKIAFKEQTNFEKKILNYVAENTRNN